MTLRTSGRLADNSDLLPSVHIHLECLVLLAKGMEAGERSGYCETHAAVRWKLCAVEFGEHNATAAVLAMPRGKENARVRRTLAALKQLLAG